MDKIKNKNYKEFFESGTIKILTEDDIKKALDNAKKSNKNKKEAQALICALYLTGARPNEILKLKAKDVYKERNYIIINTPKSKGGLPRKIYIKKDNFFAKILLNYATIVYDEMFLFFSFKGKHKRLIKTKTNKIREYTETTYKIRYHIYKWFDGVIDGSIPPYYLRHNRFSQLMEAGADLNEIRLIKGCKDLKSISPYIHLSSKVAKRAAKRIK